MVASDTVVGIVGAVVLVAVMAGVFVYEYNNPPSSETSDPEAAALHAFGDAYPSLDPHQDIDGDGKANFNDTDMDGDSIDNANDTMVGTTYDAGGNRGQMLQGTDAGATMPFYVGNGTVHIQATITYSRTSVGPVSSANLNAEIIRPDGTIVAATAEGTNSVTLSISVEDNLEAGNYTLRVWRTGPGAAVNYDGTVEVHYPAAMAPDHEHDE